MCVKASYGRHHHMESLGGGSKYSKKLVCRVVRQAARLVTGRFRLIWRLPLTGQPPRHLGFDKLGSFLVTKETPRLVRFDKSGFGALLGFALEPKNRFRTLLSASRVSPVCDRFHVPVDAFQPNQTGM